MNADVVAAVDGDRDALERIVRDLQPDLHRLALRFFGCPDTAQDATQEALIQIITRIGCTLAMMLCLDRGHRLAYILGEIMELEHNVAAEVLGITPAAYRKRLQRARADITGVMRRRCGVFDERNPCRCKARIPEAIARRRIDPHELVYASARDQARQFPAVTS